MVLSRPSNVKIIWFHEELLGYVISTIKSICSNYPETKIHIVHWDKKDHTTIKYNIKSFQNITFTNRSEVNTEDLCNLLFSYNPDIIYLPGWSDNGYLKSVKRYKKLNPRCITICGIDDQWWGTLRQIIGSVYFKIKLRKIFDFMWVSGKPQYHFVQRLGYDHERIISNLYSADSRIFSGNTPAVKRFVFVGRFGKYKGLDVLLKAYSLLPKRIKDEWNLTLIGSGELTSCRVIQNENNITVMPAMQPGELLKELKKGGVACMPSYFEQWGVAIHEMALLGYPLITSSACGAASEFLITNFNGFMFRRGDHRTLQEALLSVAMLDIEELKLFGDRSRCLAKRITPALTAHSFMSSISLFDLPTSGTWSLEKPMVKPTFQSKHYYKN